MKTAKEYVNENYNFDKHGLAECSDVYIMKSHEDFSSLQNRSLVEENERLREMTVCDDVSKDFINQVERMRELYSKQRYTQAEQLRDRLGKDLDDVMRSALSYKEEKKNG